MPRISSESAEIQHQGLEWEARTVVSGVNEEKGSVDCFAWNRRKRGLSVDS